MIRSYTTLLAIILQTEQDHLFFTRFIFDEFKIQCRIQERYSGERLIFETFGHILVGRFVSNLRYMRGTLSSVKLHKYYENHKNF